MRMMTWITGLLLLAGPGLPYETLAQVAGAGQNPGPRKFFSPAGGEEEKFDINDLEFQKLKERYEKEKRKQPYERIITIEGFGDFPCKGTVPFLKEVIEDNKDKPALVAAAVRALGKVGTLEAVETIVMEGIPPLTGDFNVNAVAKALSNTLKDDAEEWLIKNGLSDPVRKNPEVLKIMLGAISNLRSEKRIDLLQKEIRKAKTPELLIHILHGFRDSPPRNAAKIVKPFIRMANADVKVAVLEVLIAVKDTKNLSEYRSLLRNNDWRVRSLAVDLVVLCNPRRIVTYLKPLLADPEHRVRIGVIRGLMEAAGPEVMDPLIGALDKNEGRVRDDIADALARITGKNFGPIAVQWESWWAANKGKVQIQKMSAREFAKLKESDSKQATSTYYGLRVISKNMVFVIDYSGSMMEAYVPPAGYEPPSPLPPEKPGKTKAVAAKKSPADKGAGGASGRIQKIEVAKAELLKVLRSLPSGVKVNIVPFNTFVRSWKPGLTTLTPSSKREASKFVTDLTPEGMTNVSGALERAFADEKVDTIYFLSDGAPTHGITSPVKILEEVAKTNRLRKVKIHTIGFHLSSGAEKLMERLAEQNYGVFLAR